MNFQENKTSPTLPIAVALNKDPLSLINSRLNLEILINKIITNWLSYPWLMLKEIARHDVLDMAYCPLLSWNRCHGVTEKKNMIKFDKESVPWLDVATLLIDDHASIYGLGESKSLSKEHEALNGYRVVDRYSNPNWLLHTSCIFSLIYFQPFSIALSHSHITGRPLITQPSEGHEATGWTYLVTFILDRKKAWFHLFCQIIYTFFD